jgi:hypothetical protein
VSRACERDTSSSIASKRIAVTQPIGPQLRAHRLRQRVPVAADSITTKRQGWRLCADGAVDRRFEQRIHGLAG